MNEKGLTIIRDESTDLTIRHDPQAVVDAAIHASQVLTGVLARKKDPVMIKGEQFLEYEDWQTLAQFYSVTVRTMDPELVEIGGVRGFRARAEVIDLHTGMVIGGAEAYCMSDEDRWGDKPLFQLASMAQTRAGAKALRNRLAWVAVLGGYRPTPAEEMTGNEDIGQGAKAQDKEHWCKVHNVAFREYTSKTDPSKHWYSHRDGEGWCNEAKARETAPEAPRTNGKAEQTKAEIDQLQATFETLYGQCDAAGLKGMPAFKRPCTLSEAKESVKTIRAIWDGSGAEQEAMPV